MNKKIIAWIIALAVILGPFRWAFLEYKEPGVTMILSFIAVLAGVIVFYYLTLNHKQEHH
jgi:purine-cytosine permease-like protein